MISGGIAAYKIPELVRQLIKLGATVRVAMTTSATHFVTPLTLQTLTKSAVLVDTFDENSPDIVQHIDFADWCDVVLVAPATANLISKLANGLADDVVSTILLAVHCPILVVPAMNVNMYNNSAVQRNIKQLEQDGCHVMEPEVGFLAEGYEGKGRLPELTRIVQTLELLVAKHFLPQLLQNKKVIVSAGGTRERIDPVRYISNDSTGKMGYAMARAARFLGAEVTLVSTTHQLVEPVDVSVIYVNEAQELYDVMTRQFEEQDIAIMAAAVSDYRIASPSTQKIKKQSTDSTLQLNLIENPDILQTLGKMKQAHQCVIGFAAETERVVEYAQIKRKKKQADWIIANDVSDTAIGFNSEDNCVTLVCEDQIIELEKNTKQQLAIEILMKIYAEENQR